MSSETSAAEGGSESGIDSVEYVLPSDVPALLVRLEMVSGGWLNERADLFDLHGAKTHDEYRVRRKAFTELSVYLLLGDHLPVKPVADRRNARAVVIEEVNDRLYRQALKRNPLDVRSYGYPPIFAELAGELHDEETWTALGEILNREFVWAQEQQPFALLDIWHLAKLYGAEPLYDMEEILRTSAIDSQLHPIWSDLGHIYPMTHDIMFYRGFGMDQFGFPAGPASYDVRLPHVGFVLRFLADKKYDALLELLLTGVLQRQIPPDLVGICLGHLVSVAEDGGRIPDYTVDDETVSTFNQENVEILDHLDERAIGWGAHYHANIVACYTALCVRAEWPELLDAIEEWRPPNYDPNDLLTLGEALVKLADYDLKGGARKLEAVAGTEAAEAYSAVFEMAVSYLRDQRRTDGEFGHWAEEQMTYEAMGYDAALFEDEFVEPSTKTCAAALETIEDESDRPLGEGL